MPTSDRPRVFLDIEIASRAVGRLVIELFTEKTPKTCENFRQLCTGEHEALSYEGSTFHRIIDEFMIQGGDIANGDGTGIVSIYGKEFEDENLTWRELDAANLVCSANRGKDTNGSQFFITLEAAPHLNGKHTIFGRLVSGDDTLKTIASVSVDHDDKPKDPVIIKRCGELQRRQKPTESRQRSEASERGRIRKEHAESHSGQDAITRPLTGSRKRRPSDNVMDEGLRGRPRKRSRTRADDSAIEEQSQADISSSPVKIHKRGRSPSPSPAHTSSDDDAANRRRRRSLPNQYPDRRSDYSKAEDSGRARRTDHHRLHDRHHQSRYDGARRPDGRREDYDRGRLDRGRRSDNTLTDSSRGDYSSDYGRRLHSNKPSEDGSEVKFKGRGVMKYREPDRL